MAGEKQWQRAVFVVGAMAVVGVLAFFSSSRQSSEPTLAKEDAALVPAAPVRIPTRPVRTSEPRKVSRPAPRSRSGDTLKPDEPTAPESRVITVPAGTVLDVVLNRQLSTKADRVGVTFPVALARGVIIGGETVFEQGISLTGEITALERAGQIRGKAKMSLVLQDAGGTPIQTQPMKLEGGSSMLRDIVTIGIGAGGGALFGKLLGGGAGKGAVAGAGGGTAIVLATRGRDIVLEPGQEMAFALSQNATVSR